MPGTITKKLYLVDENNHTGFAQLLEEWDDADKDGFQDAGETLLKSFVLGHDVIAQWAAANANYYLLYDGHGSTRCRWNPWKPWRLLLSQDPM